MLAGSGRTFTIRRIDREDRPLWDELVTASPQGSVFLLDECLSLWVASEPRLHSLRFGCFDGEGRLVAGQVFLHRRKAFGIRVQTCLNFPYNSSPILAGCIRPGGVDYAAILQAFARKADQLFPTFCFECHPSLQDVRPLLESGWRAVPEYAHCWDLSAPEVLLEWLGDRSRFRRANEGLGRYVFADETSRDMAQAFPALYRKSAGRYGMELEATWEATFAARVGWLLDHDAARLFTCRRKDGTLLAILVCVLSRTHRIAHGWMLAYDRSLGDKEFLRALYLYALRQLAGTAIHVDIAEGIRPALYDFKDSLGTESTPYFLVESPRADFCRKVFNVYRGTRRLMTRPSR